MRKITLWSKVVNGEIPSYEFECDNEMTQFMYKWLYSKDFENSVFVCFANFKNLHVDDLRNEQKSLLVSHSNWEISLYMDDLIGSGSDYDLCIFEFDNYKDALNYCIDLKEGF